MTIHLTAQQHGQRADLFLAKVLPDMTRSAAQRLMEEGRVYREGKPLKKNQKLRSITKPFLLLSLLGFYVFAARNVLLLIVLALFFSWLGDVLLIPKGVKWFTAGGISFMISSYVSLCPSRIT